MHELLIQVAAASGRWWCVESACFTSALATLPAQSLFRLGHGGTALACDPIVCHYLHPE